MIKVLGVVYYGEVRKATYKDTIKKLLLLHIEE